jgi:hypothetical protein
VPSQGSVTLRVRNGSQGDEPSEFVSDERPALYRFKDGEFAFSREYAN